MSYQSYSDQVFQHLMFLQSKGFDITTVRVNADFVRCHQTGKHRCRGELVYKTRTVMLSNGLTGVQTWYRGPQGEVATFQTYGLGPRENEIEVHLENSMKVETEIEKHETAARKVFGFWHHSKVEGRSEYLHRKKVGAYGIRFRNTLQYGDVAVVPMIDISGRLWNYQLLNPDGSKRHQKDGRVRELFHAVGYLNDGQPIGIAESYVTSATCFELTGIPTVCAFNCQNLKPIALLLSQRYANSRLLVFADNDRHLDALKKVNQGLTKGSEAAQAVRGGVLVVPYFDLSVASKEMSDWNDLVHQKGHDYAKAQIETQLKEFDHQMQ
jgi:phage/plasmid primase-like uncharacterized protein